MNIFCPHLQFFSSTSKVKSRLKVYKTQHLHVHGLLPCYKTCSESRKLLTDPLRCKFQVNWSCSTAPVSAAYCSASEWRGQNTAASDISERVEMSDHQQSRQLFLMGVTNMERILRLIAVMIQLMNKFVVTWSRNTCIKSFYWEANFSVHQQCTTMTREITGLFSVISRVQRLSISLGLIFNYNQ